MVTRPTALERLDAYTEQTETCWLWTRAKAKNGYGYGYMSVNNKVQPVHRIAYTLRVGPIPDGYDIDHTCFVRHCVNPAHLRAVTRKQNMEHLSGPMVTSKTGVRGVHFSTTHQCFVGELRHHRKRIRVGYFRTVELADKAVRAKRAELYTHDDANY